MYKHTAFSIIFLAFLSCAGNKEPSEEVDKTIFKSFSIDINGKDRLISRLIASVEVVSLEEGDSSYLKMIENLLINDRGQLLVYNEGGEGIHVFNRLGEFKYAVNRSGKGPKEYPSITNVWLENNTLAIYSRANASVTRYSKNGEFISRHNLPYSAGYINRSDDGYALELNYNLINDSLKYRYAILDEDFKLKETYLPYKQLPDFGNAPGVNAVMPFSNDLLLFRMMSDTVYRYGVNGFEPFIHFNFADDWFWQGKVQPEQKDFFQIPDAGKVWELATSVGEDFIYVKGFVAYDGWEHFLIDRNSGQVIRLDMGLDKQQAFNMVNLGWFEGELAMAFSAGTITDFLSVLNDEQVKGRFSREELLAMETENPVICFITFKVVS